jgi:hypothetical protein
MQQVTRVAAWTTEATFPTPDATSIEQQRQVVADVVTDLPVPLHSGTEPMRGARTESMLARTSNRVAAPSVAYSATGKSVSDLRGGQRRSRQ